MFRSQGDAVKFVVLSVLGEVQGKIDYDSISDSDLKQMHEMLFGVFMRGESTIKSRQYYDSKGQLVPELVKKYVPGVINNWIRKDQDLNGGVKYEPKNPGIRQNSGDAQLRALKALLAQTQDGTDRERINEAIQAREAELNQPKPIDVDALPEHLRHLVKVAAVAPIVRKAQ